MVDWSNQPITAMAKTSWSPLSVLLALALTGCAQAYPDLAGSCEGVFSGAHVRGLRHQGKRDDGGWSFEVSPPRTGSGNTKSALVSLVHPDPQQQFFSGFLLKSFDLETGQYIGAFSQLPMYTELFAGCPVPAAAVHHNARGYWDGTANGRLTVKVEWPADRELGFVCFLVKTQFEWFEVFGSTTGKRPAKGLHDVELYQGIFSPRLGKAAWAYLYLGFYVPMLLLVFVGAAAKESNSPGQLGGKLNHTVPAKTAPAVLRLSLGEWLSIALFYVVQIVILALMTLQIESGTHSRKSLLSLVISHRKCLGH